MVQVGTQNNERNQAASTPEGLARLATNIRTVADFAKFMTSLMGALAGGTIDHQTAKAISATAQVMLKAIELQQRFASVAEGGGTLLLTAEPTVLDERDIRAASVPAKRAVAPPLPPSREQKAKQKGPHCVDCYVAHQLYITGTMEDEGESLCVPHFNNRHKAAGSEKAQ